MMEAPSSEGVFFFWYLGTVPKPLSHDCERYPMYSDILPMEGIDVSHWQGKIDYKAYKASGGEFVIIKHSGANTGSLYVSSSLSHLKPARDAGLKIGFYYVVNGHLDIAEQATYFIDNVRKVIQKGDIVVLDNETLDRGIAFTVKQATQWLDIVSESLDITPFYYSYPALIKRSNHSEIADKYPLWLAAFNGNDGTTEGGFERHMAFWDLPSIWQFTSNGSVTGYGSRIDKNLARADIFEKYGYLMGETIDLPAPEKPSKPSKPEEPAEGLNLPKTSIDGVMGPITWTRLQTWLKAEWGYSGKIDGIAGPLTYKALQRYANSL